MSAFTFDTSGAVRLPRDNSAGYWPVFWSDLSPFMQGYVRAAFESMTANTRLPAWKWARFDRLAPATLAAMMADCERMQSGLLIAKTEAGGREAWELRQSGWTGWGAGVRRTFPPLTLTIGDDGKVYQEARK